MEYTVSRKRTVQELLYLKCDSCGSTFDNGTDEGMLAIQEFLRINTTCGYGSVIGDMTQIEADICEKCLVKHLGHALRKTKYGY